MAISKIEWTDFVWNPVTGCSKVSEGCCQLFATHVMPRNKTTRPATLIKAFNFRSASTRAKDFLIRLVRKPSSIASRARKYPVMRYRWRHLKIFLAIIYFVAVQMMYLFSWFKSALQLLFCNKTVLIYIATIIRKMMPEALNQNVSIGSHYSAAFPIWILFTFWE